MQPAAAVTPAPAGALVEMQASRRSLSAADVREHVNLIQSVMQAVMKKDTHYGVIPGCKQPSLYKAGSEVLLATFRIAVSVQVEDLSDADCVRYRVRTIGTHQATGVVVGEGIGECSSNEAKYKWRACYVKKEFENTPESRRRIKYKSYQGKESEQMEVRTDPADVANTILKMAKKRAQIDLTLTATAASDIFTQDIEDLPEELRGEEFQRTGTQQAGAAVAKSQPQDTEARRAIVAKLEEAAKKGTEAYATAWTSSTKEDRQLVGTDEHNRLKAVAAGADAPKETPNAG